MELNTGAEMDAEITLALRVAKRLETDGDHGATEAEAIRSLVRRVRMLEERVFNRET